MKFDIVLRSSDVILFFLAVCYKSFEKRRAVPNDANGSSDSPSTEWPGHARKIKKIKGKDSNT